MFVGTEGSGSDAIDYPYLGGSRRSQVGLRLLPASDSRGSFSDREIYNERGKERA